MELRGKVALVTGASRRIGKAIATALAQAGADVAVHYHSSQQQAQATCSELCALGVRAELFAADLADPDQIERMFTGTGGIAEKFGRLDVLVNSAATYQPTPLQTLTAQQWDSQFIVNSRAPALCICHAIPLMKAGGGAIVNITDISADSPRANYAAYCASKAALLALTKSTAKALAQYNIRVNSVAPGAAQWPDGATEQYKQQVLACIPLKRAGTPQDIARAVVFLAQSDYITGQNLRVDGGGCMM